MVVLLNLIFVPQAIGQCSSGPTCPLHNTAGSATSTCKILGYSKAFAFGLPNSGKWRKAYQFPSKGLYTLAKISKDETNCCVDLEVQAFMCQVLRSGTPVSLALCATTTHLRDHSLSTSI